MNSIPVDRRAFLKTAALAGSACFVGSNPLSGASAPFHSRPARLPHCNRIPGASLRIGGHVQNYLSGITAQWLMVAPVSNPAMLEMFRDRDRHPLRDLVPWAGEFAGKHLVSAVQVWRVTGDAALKDFIAAFVKHLIRLQADDGYLGPWPKESRLTGRAPNVGPKGGETWDAWGHYHIMLGLLLWHEDTGDAAALNGARRIGDLFCAKFKEARLVDTGSTEMNLAPIHSLCLLYRRTGESRYLVQAQKICDEFAATGKDGKPLAGDYLNAALAGKDFYQMPKPRWESLHPIMGLAELYWITGDAKYRRAFEHIWWSIVKLDRHNNGGFSSGEQAQGNPYHPGAIETCCTIAWTALSVEMLRLTGNSIVADELELATLNSVTGMHSPNGRWVTYNTPMDGTRKASAHDIVFQARAGSPELNCCSVNGARGFGLLSDWALMKMDDGLALNWYGPSSMTARVTTMAAPASGRRSGIPGWLGGGNSASARETSVTLTQETDYPRHPRVRLTVSPANSSARFPLHLRIPHWSRTTSVRVNGDAVAGVRAGRYLSLEREWRRNDTVEIEFDFSFHLWRGERECQGKVSVYRGPLLLAYDRRFNEMDPDRIPALDARGLRSREVVAADWLPPLLLLEFVAGDGRKVRLCDFGSAGVGGSPYRSWLQIDGAPTAPFSTSNPLRSARV
jgi:DUF1680 family protein